MVARGWARVNQMEPFGPPRVARGTLARSRVRPPSSPEKKSGSPVARSGHNGRLVRSDEELMLEYRRGAMPAFEELFRRYAPLLRGLLRRRLWSDALVEELVQQTFLQLHRARHDFDATKPLRPWVITIALNLAREHERRRGRRPQLVSLEAVGDRVANGAQPHARFEAGRDVSRALGALPEEQREVILLHWVEGLSYAQIGAAVGISEGAARLRAHRGTVALRELLGSGNETVASSVRKDA